MRNLIFTTIIGLIILLPGSLLAQSDSHENQGEQYYRMGEFFRWGHGFDGERDFEKAAEAYGHAANHGHPGGYMGLGEMYQRGKGGLAKDNQKAFDLFMKAYTMGNGRACYNLAMAYFYGKGCEADYKKMLEYMNEGINRADHSSVFGLGVMYYKGWGVQQSYTRAVELFEQAVPLGSSSAKYYLGICYRNGYGVKKNKQKADSFLTKATRMCPFAEKELNKQEGEIERGKKIKKKEYDAPDKYLKTNNSATINEFEGQWSGHITIYDWSGQYKLDQEEVELNIVLENDLFVGTGNINGEPVEISGFNNQYGIEFNSAEFKYNNHYFGNQKLIIESGSFETYEHGSKDVLAGSIDLFSTNKNCPERPAYLVLSKKKPKTKSAEIDEPAIAEGQTPDNTENTEIAQNTPPPSPDQDQIQGTGDTIANQTQNRQTLLDELVQSNIDTKVWPVPFTNTINVEYNLKENSNVLIRMVSVDGKKVHELSNMAQPAGLQTKQFNVKVNRGVYLLQVITKTQKSTTRVIKR